MKQTLSLMTLDLRSLRLVLSLISVLFIIALVSISTDGSIIITKQAIASTTGDGDEEAESDGVDEENGSS